MESTELRVRDFFDLDVEAYLNQHVSKALFGGYSTRHVEQFFCEMNKDMIAMKDNLERQINDLTLENNCLVQEIEVLREQLKATELKNMTLSQALEAGGAGKASLHLAQENAQLRGELEQRDRDLIQKDCMIGEVEERLKREEEQLEKMCGELKTMQDSHKAIKVEDEETDMKKDTGFLELLTLRWNEYKENKQELAEKINFLEASRVQIRLWCSLISDISNTNVEENEVPFAEYHAKIEKQSQEMRTDFENLIKEEVTIEQILSNMTFMSVMNNRVMSGLTDSIKVMHALSEHMKDIIADEEVRLTVLQQNEIKPYSGDLDIFTKEFENKQEAMNLLIKEKMDYQDKINRYTGIYNEINQETTRLEDTSQRMMEESE